MFTEIFPSVREPLGNLADGKRNSHGFHVNKPSDSQSCPGNVPSVARTSREDNGTRTPLPDGRDSRTYLANLAELEGAGEEPRQRI
jgi:hypothetical protein